MHLIVGLGNPGDKYKGNGRILIDELWVPARV